MLKSVPEGDDDDLIAEDIADSDENESQDEENSAQDDGGSIENNDEFEGILEQDMTLGTEHDIDIEATEPLESDNEDELLYDDDGDFATFLDEDDQLAQKPKKGRRNQSEKMRLIASKLGYSGDYFSKKGAEFATADEFESLINAEESDDAMATKRTETKSNKRKKKSKETKGTKSRKIK